LPYYCINKIGSNENLLLDKSKLWPSTVSGSGYRIRRRKRRGGGEEDEEEKGGERQGWYHHAYDCSKQIFT